MIFIEIPFAYIAVGITIFIFDICRFLKISNEFALCKIGMGECVRNTLKFKALSASILLFIFLFFMALWPYIVLKHWRG